MKVVYDIKEFNPQKPVVLTQGTFDGVHFGHRKICVMWFQKQKKLVG